MCGNHWANAHEPLSEHERTLLDRKQQHHDAFEARRERLEEEEELERQRNRIMKEKVASVQQEVSADRATPTTQKLPHTSDNKRRKALLEKMVAKKVRKSSLV